MRTSEFKEVRVEKVYSLLGSSKNGLSNEEASVRLAKYGYNEIKEKKKNPVLLFLGKLFGPIPLILWAIMFLSYILHHIIDFYVVFSLLIFNAIVSFAEEYKADHSLELLKQRLSINARVLRSGTWSLIPSRELVTGDILRIRLGDIVPADVKIIETEDLECDESELTGESLPVAKKNGDIVYAGSLVKRGEASCIVVNTGENTYFGKTAELVKTAKPKSHLELLILNIVKYLMAIDIIIVITMFLYGLLAINLSVSIILPFLLIVFVASVPVALPATFTVAMAFGTEKLAKKSILVTKLESMEETSTMNILCMDKTGTLTENKIEVKEIVPANEYNIIKYAAECSRIEDNDPIDIAVLAYAKNKGIKRGSILSFRSFDPETKMSSAKVKDKKVYEVSKGAPQIIVNLCKLTKPELSKIDKIVDELSSRGYRSIAVARKDKEWNFIGIIGLYDPPRKDSKELVDELKNLGVKLIMLTGDNIAVAKTIASEIDIGDNIIDFLEVSKSKNFENLAKNADGFAGIYPEDKFMIVKSLQGESKIIGMTGDGVNDAPALKEADVGIAVANATDVAKSAADLVLTEKGLRVIVDAVKESRKIFERMITYTIVKIVKIIQILTFVALIFFLLRFIPITSTQLLLLIFTNDITNMGIATDNANYSYKPNVWKVSAIIYSSLAIGIILLFEALFFLPISFSIFRFDIAEFQTIIFLMLSLSDKFTIYNIREKRFFWKSRPSTSLLATSVAGVIATILIAYFGIFMQSIGILPILVALLLGFAFMFAVDLVKIYVFKKLGIH
ncbi:MAG: plasma-membrane proton-efflux P-type ATPase [Candidatus Micrarchaeia archaeon]